MKETKVTIYKKSNVKTSSMHKKELLRTAVYCRVSTEHEAQKSSLLIQKKAFEDLVKKEPRLLLTEVYMDQGKSGGSREKREAFNQMIRHCYEGKIDLVITKSISRFGRNLADTAECIRDLKGLGVPVYFEEEHLNTMDPSADLVIFMLAAIAQEELNAHSRSIRWVLQQSACLGKPSRAVCYGYEKNQDAQWKIVPSEAEKIQLIFQMAAEQNLYEELIYRLNDMERKEGSSFTWNKNKVYRILKKEEYMGDILTHKTISIDYLTHRQVKNKGLSVQYYIKDHHEPIISRELFHTVQAVLWDRYRCKKIQKDTEKITYIY